MTFDSFYDVHWMPKADYFRIHRKRFLQSWSFLESVGIQSKGTVLDVGGAGPLSIYLKELGGWTVTETKTDLRAPLPLSSNEFDLVICTETIEHIKDLDSNKIQDLEAFNYSGVRFMLQELKRVMRPDGHLFVTTPNANSYITLSKWINCEILLMDPQHVREFTVCDLSRVAQEVGLYPKIIKTFDSWGEHFGEDLLKSLIEHLPSIGSCEREDNIFAMFTKSE